MSFSRRDVLRIGAGAGAGLATAGCFPSSLLAQGRKPVGLALCIGLNQVDPVHYQGWSGRLAGCIPDANDMTDIAHSKGFLVHRLLDGAAKRDVVQDRIRDAANLLQSGDMFLVTYSGHGGQVTDTNGDEVDDHKDETWCLFDGQLIDDELAKLWSLFKPGVRIVVFSDSCHSGTMLRFFEFQKFSKEVADLAGEHAVNSKANAARGKGDREAAKSQTRDMVNQQIEKYEKRAASREVADFGDELSPIRAMPEAVEQKMDSVYRKDYQRFQKAAGSERAARDNTQATVILISGCQDNQTSGDGPGNGLFTGAMKKVWANGAFSGNYNDFRIAIQRELHGAQSPNYFVVGTQNRAFENQRPLTIV